MFIMFIFPVTQSPANWLSTRCALQTEVRVTNVIQDTKAPRQVSSRQVAAPLPSGCAPRDGVKDLGRLMIFTPEVTSMGFFSGQSQGCRLRPQFSSLFTSDLQETSPGSFCKQCQTQMGQIFNLARFCDLLYTTCFENLVP